MKCGMKVLITGGLGLIGREIVEVLSHSGIKTVTFGRSPLPDTVSLPGNTIHEVGSVLIRDRLLEVMRDHKITHIVHAAGARTSDCAANSLLALESNVMGMNIVFRAAIEAGTIEKFVFLSSAALYGKVDQKIDESYEIAPTSHYAVSKAAAEMVVTGLGAESKITTAIVRPGFVMSLGNVGGGAKLRINTLIASAMNESEVEVKLPRRIFLHAASDLAESIVELLVDNRAEGVFHLPGIALSIDEFCESLKNVAGEFGRSPKITMKVDEDLAVPSELDFTRFKTMFGSEPIMDLESMIREAANEVKDSIKPQLEGLSSA
jgi:nucleoside-diphosphate-sugar epimerase